MLSFFNSRRLLKNLKQTGLSMKNSILFICLSLVLFSCGSSGGGGSKYQELSIEHLENVFYRLYDNFTIEEGRDVFRVMPDDNLTGDESDFVATLEAKLIESGFDERDIATLRIGTDINSPNGYEIFARVRISTGVLYNCNLEGIRQTFSN